MLRIFDLQGLWRRSLIVWPDGRRDDSTAVSWLQGPTFYADLRAPPDRPSFGGVSGRDDLTRDQVAWLATQEGFAGRIFFDGQFFEWQRVVDFQPESPHADAGRLWFDQGRMIEEGRDIPYIEHWHRDDRLAQMPCGALQLSDQSDGCSGFLVRVGTLFMYARDRPTPLPAGGTLSGYAKSASLEVARTMVDCELSFGRVGASGWLIESSSLPYREGARLRPAMAAGGTQFRTGDVAASADPRTRDWTIVDCEGDIALVDESVAAV